VGAEGIPIGGGSSFSTHPEPRWAGEDAPWGLPVEAARTHYQPGSCPVSEAMGERVVCLEVYPTITERDCDDVLAAILKVEAAYRA